MVVAIISVIDNTVKRNELLLFWVLSPDQNVLCSEVPGTFLATRSTTMHHWKNVLVFLARKSRSLLVCVRARVPLLVCVCVSVLNLEREVRRYSKNTPFNLHHFHFL